MKKTKFFKILFSWATIPINSCWWWLMWRRSPLVSYIRSPHQTGGVALWHFQSANQRSLLSTLDGTLVHYWHHLSLMLSKPITSTHRKIFHRAAPVHYDLWFKGAVRQFKTWGKLHLFHLYKTGIGLCSCRSMDIISVFTLSDWVA